MRAVHAVAAAAAVLVLSLALTLGLRVFVHFARPGLLPLVVIPAVLTGLWTVWQVQRERLIARLGAPDSVRALTAELSRRRQAARVALVVAASLFVAWAAARPQWGEETRQVQRQGIDVVLAVDVSRSMLAEDVAPNRLRVAVREIDSLLQRLDGDRVGLVVFAGVAFVQSPLTTDYGAIRLYLDRLRPDQIPVQGTAIGRAIEESRRLLVGGENESFRRAQNQLVIVLTDGEDHETEPVAAAQAAQRDGIRVYTVGIGTETGGRIPMRDRAGELLGFLTDRDGQVVETRLEDGQLADVAAAGGGRYQRYTTPGSLANFIERAIERYDAEALSSVLRARYVDRPVFFLLPAFLLLFTALLLGERRPGGVRVVAPLTTLLLATAPFNSGCTVERLDPEVRAAIEASRQDDHELAVTRMDESGREAREQASWSFNRGLIHERAGLLDEAQRSYLDALGASDEGVRTRALLGLANVLVRMDDLDGAIERYRRVLARDPGNEVARRNLEIAMRLRFPPCARLDDEHEPNDSAEAATPLPVSALRGPYAELFGGGAEPSEPERLVLCGGNDDWFVIPAVPGSLVSVRVDLRRLRDDDGGPPLPDRIAPTDVRIALHAPGQPGPLAVDQGLAGRTDSEPVGALRVQRRVDDVAVGSGPVAASAGEPGQLSPLLLQLEANGRLEYSYTVEVTITPPCSLLEDDFEDNDTPATARVLETGQHGARLCVDDDDWYTVPMGNGADLFVDVTPLTEPGREPAPLQWRFDEAEPGATGGWNRLEPPALAELAVRDVWEPRSVRFGLRTVDGHEGNYAMDVHRFMPCPDGNDRFEPNDDPATTITPLTADDHILRHLRLCPGDQDWFLMELPEDEEDADAGAGIAGQRAFSALVEYETPERTVLVELFDPRSGVRIAESVAVGETDYDSGAPGAVIAVAALPSDMRQVAVRVWGDSGYYHLRFPDTQPAPQQDSDPSQSDSSDGDDDADSDQDRDADPDAAEREQDDSDGEQDRQDDGDDTPEPQDEGDDDMTAAEREARRRELLELLNSLEADDVNLQLIQALDAMPPVRMRNEW